VNSGRADVKLGQTNVKLGQADVNVDQLVISSFKLLHLVSHHISSYNGIV